MTYIAPATKVLRHPDVLAAMQRGEMVMPLHVEMDLSDACNLRCAWCRFADRRSPRMMPTLLAMTIVDQLVEIGVRAVTFSGGGEPTCNPEFETIAHYAADRGLALGMYTNGVCTEAILDVAGCFRWIYISLDAADAASHAALKGCDHAYAMACATVEGLVALDDGPVVGVGYLLSADNRREAERMAQVALGLGADYCQFRPMAGLDDYAWVPGALEHLGSLAGDSVLVHAGRFCDLYDHWRGCYRRGYEACRASALGPCIGADGTVWICPNTRGLRPLGNLGREPLRAIWARRAEQHVGLDCEPTCRHHTLNRTLALVCEPQAHEEFV